MASIDEEGNVIKCPPPHHLSNCSCGPLICMCSATSPIKMAAMDQEGNILPKFSSSMLSVLLPAPPPPRASPLGPTLSPCTRWGVLPAATYPPLPPLLLSDFDKVCHIAVKTKKQLDVAQMEIKKMSKVIKSRKRKASILPLPTAVAEATAPVSSLSYSWSNMMVQLRSQSSLQMQEMRATIAAKDTQLKHQKREIERLNTKVASLTHDNNLAHLSLQQNLPTLSSSSIQSSVSITGSVFDSTLPDSEPEILEEQMSPDVSVPSPAQIVRREEESSHISRMLDSVDKLAKQYSPKDRYHKPSTNLSKSRDAVIPDSLFNYELSALWIYAEEPTEEELAQYDRHLEQELRPPPIYSPPLRRPYVNWNTLNKHRRKNLPDPQIFPVSSVPADPSFYTDEAKYKPADKHIECLPSGLYATKEQCGCAKCLPPFGTLYGLMTDMGIIGMPTDPVHGYCWDDDTAGWVIATGCC